MSYAAAPLPYAHDALVAKGISKEQVTFHYDKHHKGYATKLNAAAETDPSLNHRDVRELIRTRQGAIFNSAAQLYNHDFYWQCLSPTGGGEPTGELKLAIEDSFGTIAKFKEDFTAAANGHFGSGWAWLVKDRRSGRLRIYQSHDAGCPLTHRTLVPLLVCDVWEHAYYIDYRNDRAAYVKTFWNLVNWKYVAHQYAEAVRTPYIGSDL